MKAVIYDKKAHPDKLVVRDIEKPVPTAGEVLVKIFAVSINAADYRSMKMGMIPKKKIFGADIAGRVVSVGKNIRRFQPGDEVVGEIAAYGFGGFAEYAVAPEKLLVHKPVNVSFEDAAALPMAALTALQALRDKGKIQAGSHVLIIGSGGGVGTFAVQLAKYFSARVTAVCSTNSVEQTKNLGANDVIDYTKEKFLKSNRSYDIILAVNGNYPLSACKKRLNPQGIYVMVGGTLSQVFKAILFGWALSLGSKKIRFLAAKPGTKDLEFIMKLANNGRIKPVIETYFPLEKTAEAVRYLSEGHAKGKVVIKVQSAAG
jgi:NADPH:quinone reductase-like Zn-dependent oxidoreductase